MAANNGVNNNGLDRQPNEFEMRRAELVGQIGDSLEQVLTQINALNRSLEGIIEIGNEFASVEELWSQFESVLSSQQTAEEQQQNSREYADDADNREQ